MCLSHQKTSICTLKFKFPSVKIKYQARDGKQNSFVTGQICGQSRAKFKAEEEWKCWADNTRCSDTSIGMTVNIPPPKIWLTFTASSMSPNVTVKTAPDSAVHSFLFDCRESFRDKLHLNLLTSLIINVTAEVVSDSTALFQLLPQMNGIKLCWSRGMFSTRYMCFSVQHPLH